MQIILLRFSYLASLFVHVISYHYIGCYKDSLSKPLFDGLEQKGPYIDLDLSTKGCVDYCAERKFSYVAVQNGIMCYCSNVLPTETPANSSYCDVLCPNNSMEKCGGLTYDSVYSTFVPDHALPHDESVSKFLSPQMPATMEQRRPVPSYIIVIYCVVGIIVAFFLAFFLYTWRAVRKHHVPLEESKEPVKREGRFISSFMQAFVDRLRPCSTRRGKIAATA